ncbi:hypothetical protein [Paracoccus fontiphilus]|nr:hypothetical protein [Paracoccus fontiphilus]
MTETFTTAEGRAYVFVAVDHCSGEFVGIHAASGASRWEALDPIRQGVARHFGALDSVRRRMIWNRRPDFALEGSGSVG